MPSCRRPFSVAPLRALFGRAGAVAPSAIDDLPLMPGLDRPRPAGLAFDAALGRIVEVVATGRLDRRAVLDFYGAALPARGWQRLAEARFGREREVLDLGFSETAGTLTVRFAIAVH